MWLNTLYSKKKKVSIGLFLVLPLFLFASYFISYFSMILEYNLATSVSLICAAIWALFLGPFLIGKWYRDFNAFIKEIDDSFNAKKGNSAKDIFLRNNSSKWIPIIHIAWTAFIVLILLLSQSRIRLRSYYLYGFTDINYWFFVIYVGFIAFLSSYGLSILIVCSRTICTLIEEKERIQSNLLQAYGMHTYGDVVRKTALYFCSGFLFFPILIEFSAGSIVLKIVYLFALSKN